MEYDYYDCQAIIDACSIVRDEEERITLADIEYHELRRVNLRAIVVSAGALAMGLLANRFGVMVDNEAAQVAGGFVAVAGGGLGVLSLFAHGEAYDNYQSATK